MLKISIDVLSGISGFEDRVKTSPENRDVFLQGILLFLMGERVSLYALNDNGDEQFSTNKVKLENFLSKLSLKAKISASTSNFDVMSFSQHKKDGAPRFAGHAIIDQHLTSLDSASRLNPEYEQFVKDGLFDMFDIPHSLLIAKLAEWEKIRQHFADNLSVILQSPDSYSDSKLTKSSARNVCRLTESVIHALKLPALGEHDVGRTPYNRIMSYFEQVDTQVKTFNSNQKRVTDELRKDAKEFLTVHQIRMTLFLVAYLSMYIEKFKETKPGACSSFGIKSFDMKTKKVLSTYLKSLDGYETALTEKPSSNGETEFYKGIFKCSPYSVATNAPVLARRYDGRMDLFINAETTVLQSILKAIQNSNRYYLNVGKRSLGILRPPSGLLPSSRFTQIKDDVKSDKP